MSNSWYMRYYGDYARDTGHLTLAEHGAYTKLLDHYYASGKPLPTDDAALHRICCAMTPEEQAAVTSVAGQFFPVNGDGLRHNKRADKEIAIRDEKSDKARASAAVRWENERKADGMRTQCERISDGNAIQSPEFQSPESKGKTPKVGVADPGKPDHRQTRVKTFKQWDRCDLLKSVKTANEDNMLTDLEVIEFVDYWMEPSATGRSRMSLERTWDTRRRMQTAVRMVYEKQRSDKDGGHINGKSWTNFGTGGL